METVLNYMGYTSRLCGITNPLYRFMYGEVMAQLLREKLLRDIRGEKLVISTACTNVYIEEPCLNCYAFGMSFGEDKLLLCMNHSDIDLNTVNFRKVSYLQFLKMSYLWNLESVFTFERHGIKNHTHEANPLDDIHMQNFHMILDSCPDIKYLKHLE